MYNLVVGAYSIYRINYESFGFVYKIVGIWNVDPTTSNYIFIILASHLNFFIMYICYFSSPQQYSDLGFILQHLELFGLICRHKRKS